MKILLTNDDGIDAPGLSALHECVQQAFSAHDPDVLVVAPDRGRSECSHGVTGGRPLTVNEVRPGWISVDGTPVDCVRVGLTALMPRPTMVLSGINAGANLGVNLMVSGTFAAAREAALLGVPAMALSHYRRPDVPKSWEHTPRWTMSTLAEFARVASEFNSASSLGRHELNQNESMVDATSEGKDLAQEWRRGTPLWNVNLPAIDPENDVPPIHRCGVDVCPIDRKAIRDGLELSFQLDFHGRPREAGTDVDLCFAGNVTISELSPHLATP